MSALSAESANLVDVMQDTLLLIDAPLDADEVVLSPQCRAPLNVVQVDACPCVHTP